jgi:hypothetical protein
MKEPRFLLLEEGLGIHAHQIETYGGGFGVRDARLLLFLELNGVSIDAPDEELVEMVLRVATGEESKAAAAVFLERFRTPSS